MITLLIKYFTGSWKLLWFQSSNMTHRQVPFSNSVLFPCVRQQLYICISSTNNTTQILFLNFHCYTIIMLIPYQMHHYKNSVELSFIISQSPIWVWILNNVFWFQYILRKWTLHLFLPTLTLWLIFSLKPAKSIQSIIKETLVGKHFYAILNMLCITKVIWTTCTVLWSY